VDQIALVRQSNQELAALAINAAADPSAQRVGIAPEKPLADTLVRVAEDTKAYISPVIAGTL
jgi:hypothetical protein